MFTELTVKNVKTNKINSLGKYLNFYNKIQNPIYLITFLKYKVVQKYNTLFTIEVISPSIRTYSEHFQILQSIRTIFKTVE